MSDWVIRGTGPVPTIEVAAVPPAPPPPPPPPPPLPPPPPPDNSPFVFPGQPSSSEDPSNRNEFIGNDPVMGGPYYVALFEYGNPLSSSHLYAGQIPDGRRLWVPRDATPFWIRRALALGHL